MIDFGKVLTVDFWFIGYPGAFSQAFLYAAIFVFFGLVLAGVFLRFLQYKHRADTLKRTLFRKSATATLITGTLGLVIMFFRQEQVYVLGSRFWYVVLLLFLAGSMLLILRANKKQVVHAA